MTKILLLIISLFTLFIVPYNSASAKPIIIDDALTTKPIGIYVEYIEDEKKIINITKNTHKSEIDAYPWLLSKQEGLSFGFTKSVYWIRFSIKNISNHEIEWYLVQHYPLVSYIDFYEPNDNNGFHVIRTGTQYRFSERPLEYRTFVFPLKLQAGKEKTYYLRYENRRSMNIVLSIFSPKDFEKMKDTEAIFLWLLYGMLLIMIVYHIFIFLSIRDISYLYYIFFITFVLLLLMSIDGSAYQYLWPNAVWWGAFCVPFFLAQVVITNLQFMRYFLQTNKNFKIIDAFFILFISISFIIIITMPFLNDYRLSLIVSMANVVVTICYNLPVLIYLTIAKKSRPSLFALISYSFFFICSMILLLKTIGFLTDSAFTRWILHIGVICMITLLSLGLADRINTMRKELRDLNVSLEDKVKNRTIELEKANDKLKEVDKLKSNFFSNISHEIRTPLTLILSPIESVLQGDFKQAPDESFLHNIHRNAVRLLRLVNNLLDFSKIEAGKMSYLISEVNIVRLLHIYTSLIESAAQLKNVAIQFHALNDPIILYLDRDKTEKVVMNLFSNALKFTEKGSITISITEDDTRCYLSIADTGDGIPKDKIPIIFNRFSQVDSSSTRRYEGTGIGLALVKEFVEEIGGTITVESRYKEEFPENHGTTFTITYNKGKEHLEGKRGIEFLADEDMRDQISDFKNFTGMFNPDESKQNNEQCVYPGNSGKLSGAGNDCTMHSILVVEDNPDMRTLLINLLRDRYSVYCASDGEDGLSKAQEFMPDAIITDVMMPRMNGYVMTKRIKEDPSLQRIPVLMITAKADILNKIEGLEHGADDYLTKPFNSKELLARVAGLIKTHEYQKLISIRNREIENDLEIARLIINNLLPEQIPVISGYQSHAIYIPMEKIGGDFYDISIHDNLLEIFIADVSGHGLPSAFIALITKITFDSIINKLSPSRVLYLINDAIVKATVKSNYVTAFYCVINTNTNMIYYSNAGHIPLLMYRSKSDEFFELKTKGKPLGLFDTINLEEKELSLQSGDRLIFYTDGIIECMNSDHMLFSEQRLKNFIRTNHTIAPEGFSETLLAYLKEFSGSEQFDDDITLVVFDVQ